MLVFEGRTDIFLPIQYAIPSIVPDHFVIHDYNCPVLWGHICSPGHHRANLLPDSREISSNVWKQLLCAPGFFPSGELSLVLLSILLFLIILLAYLFSS